MRQTGIDVIGDCAWGTHFCQFYQSAQDLTEILVPYFQAGLENNEACMWVTSPALTENQAESSLRTVASDFDSRRQKGQIEILPYSDWYLLGGAFDLDRVLNGWLRKLEEALSRGFDGLRLTGNTVWLEKKDWRAFTEYEEAINSVIGRHRMIALCTYSLEKCGGREVLDVVRNHQFALIRSETGWECLVHSDLKRARQDLTGSEGRYRGLMDQGVFAAARDVTELKAAERRKNFTNALLELFARKSSSREYLESVVEVIRGWSGCQALGIRVADENGEIPYESWSGYEPRFIEQESCLSLARDQCCCTRALTGAVEPRDEQVLTPGGSFRFDNSLGFLDRLSSAERSRYRGNCMKHGYASLAVIPIRYREHTLGAIHLADRRLGHFSPEAVEFIESITPLIGEAIRRFRAEAELSNYRDRLEDLVRQRTLELESANAQLQLEISERRKAEDTLRQTAGELARSNRDLEQFAYVASHDLQEPLRAVAGYVELLQHRYRNELDDRAREYISGAVDGAARMQRLVTDLLAFSRVGTQGLDFEPSDLKAALDAALAGLKVSIQEAGAKITSDPLPHLCIDATQIALVFQNLIGNAIKFRGGAPPEIHVGAVHQLGRWLISVRDNGIGLDPKYAERIFLIFQRLHTRRSYPGTGIGLAICKRVVERHGGNIWVESQPGQGSTFYFFIPDGMDQS
jgi:signal transduction histidine kinase